MDHENLQNESRRWKEEVYKREEEREERFSTISDLEMKELYTPLDGDKEYLKNLSFPGEYPYTRGVYPTMYRGRLWTMRQFAGFGTAEESNERYHYLINKGQTGLSVAFDMPTIMGYDSDSERAFGEVGRLGVAIDTLADMERLFEGIPLNEVSTSMTINAPAAIIWAMYLMTGEKQGVDPSHLRGTIQNDILKEYSAQKSWIFPPAPSMRLITDILEYASSEVPKWNTISISGYHIREAGSTALQELAFTLANGFAYVEAGIEAGLLVDDFAPRLSFFFNAHMDFFEEVAKYRAARRIWARHMKERFKAKDPGSLLLRFHTQTAGCSLTAQQPENNIVRTAYQALAAVLGGTQSLHTNSMDEVLALPSEKAVKIALRNQQILAYETGVANTIDPLAGSYVVEDLTRRMEEGTEEYLQQIEDLGGVLKAIELGFFQQEIADSAYSYQKSLEEEKKILVGVNRFQEEESLKMEILKIHPEIEKKQKARLNEIKEGRQSKLVEESLFELQRAASSEENLLPYILEAVKSYATLGEMISVLKEVFGTYRERAVI